VPTLTFETRLDVPPEVVADFHRSVEALTLLNPPGTRVEILGEDTEVRDGALHVVRIRRGPFAMVWKARISEVGPHGFTDTAEQSPFASWRHRHEYLPEGDGTLLRDTVEYALPFGVLGRLADRLFVRRKIERAFGVRHQGTARALDCEVSAAS
jgi:ligand-binding SRPBCC domain-containing protein